MPQAENVISFPVNPATTDFLADFIASPQERLDEVVARLTGLEAVVFLVRQAEDFCSPLAQNALRSIEMAICDCVRIAELRPVA